MFDVTKNPTFTHEVPVTVPGDGGFADQSIKTTYRVLTDDEIKKHDPNTHEGQKGLLKAAIVKMDDLQDKDEKPVKFNTQVRDLILGLSYARTALLAGYTNGMVPGQVGN